MHEWLEHASFYEIYPQSFLDTDGDGIGNFEGIIEKLDYIKSLGANALWLNPCFDSPFGDAGYDVRDYKKTAARYGTNDDLVRLFSEAHKRDMHVLLDLVPGHTSVEHPWFIESMKAEKNEFTDRYIWSDSIWNNTDSVLPSIRGISDRDGCAAVNFFSSQPALNYGFLDPKEPWQQPMDAPGPMATREAMKDVMRFWLDLGCDGFRIDMAHSLVKGDDEEYSGTVSLWQDFRRFWDSEYPEAVMVSEWGEPDKSLKGGFHMDFLLHFGPSHYNDLFRCEEPFFSERGKGSAKEFVETYLKNRAKAPDGLICIPSGNHDMDRMARYLTPAEMKHAFTFLYTMPGAPFLYYGDEIGMRFVEGLTSKEGGYSRTGARSPMQWDSSENAGFSSADASALYIPLDPSGDRPTVSAQEADPSSLLNHVRGMQSLRAKYPALGNTGNIRFLSYESYPLSYLRYTDSEELLVILNPGNSEAVTRVPLNWLHGVALTPVALFGSRRECLSFEGVDENNQLTVRIDGATSVILKVRRQ